MDRSERLVYADLPIVQCMLSFYAALNKNIVMTKPIFIIPLTSLTFKWRRTCLNPVVSLNNFLFRVLLSSTGNLKVYTFQCVHYLGSFVFVLPFILPMPTIADTRSCFNDIQRDTEEAHCSDNIQCRHLNLWHFLTIFN